MTATQLLDAPETTTQKPSKFDRKKETVLAAAARIFNRDGVRGATLADVAAEVNLNIKSLRYYFTRKDDLAAAAFLRAIDVYSNLIAEASRARSAEERVRTFIRLYFDLARGIASGEVAPFLHFGDIRSLSEPQATPIFAAFVDMFRSLRRLVTTPELEAAGRRAVNARTHLFLSQMLWSVVWIERYEADDLPRAGERMADILINGLAAAPSTSTPRVSRLQIARPDAIASPQYTFLRAATALINDQGYRGASIDRIAASINMTKGAFYHYHDAKDEVVVACFERTFEMIRGAQAVSETIEGGLDRVAHSACLLIYHQLTEAGPLLRTSALTALPAEIRNRMTRKLDRLTSRFADVVSDGIIDGSVRPCDAWIAAQMVTAAINAAEELPRWLPEIGPEDALEVYARPSIYGLYCKSGRTLA